MSRPGVEFPKAVRLAMYERDGFRCVRCGRLFPGGVGLDAHHRLLRSQGGKGTLENGISLCGSGTTGCHGWVHANVSEAREHGWIVASWDDPARTPWTTWESRPAMLRPWLEDEPGGDLTPQPDHWDLDTDSMASEWRTEWKPPG